MSLTEGIRAWLTLSAGKKLLRLAALLCLLGFLAIVAVQGEVLLIALAPAAFFGLLSVISADSEAPLIALGLAVLTWAGAFRAQAITHPSTLLAALLLLGFHVLLTMTAHTPPAARLPSGALRRWGWRTGLVGCAAVLAWFGLKALAGSPVHAPSWLRGVVLAALGLAVLLVIRRSAGGQRED